MGGVNQSNFKIETSVLNRKITLVCPDIACLASPNSKCVVWDTPSRTFWIWAGKLETGGVNQSDFEIEASVLNRKITLVCPDIAWLASPNLKCVVWDTPSWTFWIWAGKLEVGGVNQCDFKIEASVLNRKITLVCPGIAWLASPNSKCVVRNTPSWTFRIWAGKLEVGGVNQCDFKTETGMLNRKIALACPGIAWLAAQIRKMWSEIHSCSQTFWKWAGKLEVEGVNQCDLVSVLKRKITLVFPCIAWLASPNSTCVNLSGHVVCFHKFWLLCVAYLKKALMNLDC